MFHKAPSSHQSYSTSTFTTCRIQHLPSTAMRTIWPSCFDAQHGRRWKMVSTETWASWQITSISGTFSSAWARQSAAYHLSNREARRELDVYVGNNRLKFQQAPKYLGVCVDRTLSYKQHLDEVKAKITARVSHSTPGGFDLRSFPPDPTHIHASPCPNRTWPNIVPLPGAEVHT